MLKIGSHVGMSGKKMFLGSVEEALSYGSNTFMIYTGAPQNTRRKPIEELNIIYDTPENIIKFLKENDYLTISTALHEDSVNYNDIKLKVKNAYIFGNEGGGVSKYMIENSDIKAIIPIYGNIESLNVSVASGVFLYKMREKLEKVKFEGVK